MASRSLNKVLLIGNLTRDPELRYTPMGAAVCTVGLATNRNWTTETGEKKEEVEFHRLVAWNKLAELCSQLLVKGRKIYIEGRLQTRTWTGSDGRERQTTEIVMDDMIILDSKRAFEEGSHGQAQGNPQPPSGNANQAGSVTQPAQTQSAPKAVKQEEEPVNAPSQSDANEPSENVNVDDIPF
jgi:single-strand DNA-binding protein